MSPVLTIAKRDVRAFFLSPMAYIVLTAWVLWSGGSYYILAKFYAGQTVSAGSDNPLTAFFGGTIFFYLPFLVFVPLLTMRLFAGERASGTLEPLLTAPVRTWEVVLGKYLAAMSYWIALWIPTLLYVWITSRFGDVDSGAIVSSYLGVFGIGAFYMAIGLLMSSLAPNQIAAGVLGFMVIGLLFALGIAQFVVYDETREVLSYLSVWTHMNDFSKGVVDTRHLVVHATFAVASLIYAGATPLTAPTWTRARPVVVPTMLLGLGIVAFANESIRIPILASAAVLMTLFALARRNLQTDVDPAEEAKNAWTLLGCMLLMLVVIQVNYLGFRHYARWDWTSDARFTLSERSLQIAERLERDVDVHLFLSANEPNFEDLTELLQRYQAASPRIHVEHVDPDLQPAEMRRLAERFDIAVTASAEGVTLATVAAVVSSGAERWKITRDDLISLDFDSLDDESGPKIDVKAERAISGALVQVTTGRATKICVAEGHGEWSVDGGERSLYDLRSELERENVELESLPTVGIQAVPDDCDAVYVLGPQRAYAEREARVLFDYLRDGGNLLLALDPVLERETVTPSGFEDAAEELGILIDSSVVLELDPSRLLSPDPTETFLTFAWGEHEMLGPIRATGGPMALQFVRSVRAVDGGGADVLASTTEQAFAETDIAQLIADRELTPNGDDVRGPVGLAAAARTPGRPAREGETERGTGGRLFVIGDSDWLQSGFLREPQFVNFDLAMAATGWLTEREALISIPPRSSQMQSVVMTEGDLSGIALRVFGLLPGAILLLGFAVWWGRRK